MDGPLLKAPADDHQGHDRRVRGAESGVAGQARRHGRYYSCHTVFRNENRMNSTATRNRRKQNQVPVTWFLDNRVVEGFPSGCGWLEVSGGSKMRMGGTTLAKSKEKAISHRPCNPVSNAGLPTRVYSSLVFIIQMNVCDIR